MYLLGPKVWKIKKSYLLAACHGGVCPVCESMTPKYSTLKWSQDTLIKVQSQTWIRANWKGRKGHSWPGSNLVLKSWTFFLWDHFGILASGQILCSSSVWSPSLARLKIGKGNSWSICENTVKLSTNLGKKLKIALIVFSPSFSLCAGNWTMVLQLSHTLSPKI